MNRNAFVVEKQGLPPDTSPIEYTIIIIQNPCAKAIAVREGI